MVLPIRSTYLEIRGYTSYDIKKCKHICSMNLQINARSYKASYFKTTIRIATPKSCVSQAKIFAGICTSQSKLIE